MALTEEEKRERKNARQREYGKKTNYAAQQKYSKTNVKQFTIRFMTSTEHDLIEHLEKQSNKSGYIKNLIKKDIDEKVC